MQEGNTTPTALQGKRVLVCEDEGITIMQLTRAVTHAGMGVAGIAPNAQMALELARREQPDIVIVDIRIGGQDGFELVRRLLWACSACVIALVAQFGEIEMARAAGADAVLVKPTNTDELLRVLPICADRSVRAVVREHDAPASISPTKPPATV